MCINEEASRPYGYYYNNEKDIVEYVYKPSSLGDRTVFSRSDYLTNASSKIVIFDLKHPPEGMVDLKDQSRILSSLEHDLKVVKAITGVMRVHGDNHEVFGPPGHQTLIMEFKTSVQLAMKIDSVTMLRALGKPQAGVLINGSIIDEGTIVTYERLMEHLYQRVGRATALLSDKVRAAVMRQWQEAIREDVSLCSAHFTRGATDYDDLLTAVAAADYLKVSKTSLGRYRTGEIPAGYAPFPQPDKYHGRSPFWKKSTLSVWAASKR